MVEPISAAVAGKAAESFIDQTLHQLGYLWNFNKNVEHLRKEVRDLESKRESVELMVDAAKRKTKTIGPEVSGWLQNVESMMKDADEVLERTKHAQTACFSCSKCPNLMIRYSISKKARTKAQEVARLQERGKFNQVGYPTPPGQMPFASPHNYKGIESRMLMRKDIMEALSDDSITVIGVCGMAGVGKTTLAKEIADQVKAEKLFDEVAMAVGSQNHDATNIQDQLAESFGLKIEEKANMHVRAERLYARLKDYRKKVLIILDDLWHDIDFHTIGIPLNRECKGLKILITSRFQRVCWNMEVQMVFEVKILSENEGWRLFKETAEISDDNTSDGVKRIAKDVAKECRGLPLAIVIVGKALKNQREASWRDALQQLRESSVTNISGMHDEVYSVIGWSYHRLGSEESKSLLLICSLYPEDHDIPLEDLVRYAKGLELFKNVKTVSGTRDRVDSIIDELRSSHLLLPGNDRCVKLHDVVRDVCLSIASRGEHIYGVSISEWTEWPRSDSFESCTAISVSRKFDNVDQLSSLKCPKLKFLRFVTYYWLSKFNITFLDGLIELRVLELNGIDSKFPSAFQSLIKLRTLCLHYCQFEGNISVISKMKSLEILSFYQSSLKCIPYEIADLHNLKSLDLRCEGEFLLPSGFLARLKRLEELYLGYNSIGGGEGYIDVESEFSSLKYLHTIQFCMTVLDSGAQIFGNWNNKKLVRYDIIIRGGEQDREGLEYQFGKRLRLFHIKADFLSDPTMRALVRRSEDLTLCIKGLTYVIKNLVEQRCFSNLNNLELLDCDIRYLIDATNSLTNGVFVNLEKLTINKANNLEEFCLGNLPHGSLVRLKELKMQEVHGLRNLWGRIQPPSLGNLTVLHISGADSIGSLFLKSTVKCLSELKEIELHDCPMLETVVSAYQEGGIDTEVIEFPKLQYLKLSGLENCRTFGPQSSPQALFIKVILPSLEELEVHLLDSIIRIVDAQVPFSSLPKLQRIKVIACDSLWSVAVSESTREFHNLKHLEVTHCHFLDVVFDFEGLMVSEDYIAMPLHWLEFLDLSHLSNMKHISRMLPEGTPAFCNLRTLNITSCQSIRYILSPSMANMLVSLETLNICSCNLVEAIIGREEMRIGIADETPNKILLPKLQYISIDDLFSFRMLCSESVEFELPSLTDLGIRNCLKMIKFCSGQLSAAKLQHVSIKDFGETDDNEVSVDIFSSWLKDLESNIRCLSCSFWEETTCYHLNEQPSSSS